jgi:hypothetical protein
MPANRNNNLKGFFLFWKEHSDAVSKDNETAKDYLKEQGKNPDAFANDLLKKIKKKQLEHNAAKSELQFQNLKAIKDKAIQKARELLAIPGFSLLDFMKQEKFAIQNRNLENLSQDEIQNVLEDYLFLKMQQDKSEKQGDL